MEKITSAKNPLIQKLRDLKNAHARRESRLFLVEGEKMIVEALGCGLEAAAALADESHADFAKTLSDRGIHTVLTTPELLKTVCETQTPQGMCAAFHMPKPLTESALPRRLVALDGVQDPGNVGTIWRTADAAGFEAILLGAGSADPLSPKVQRSAMGSGFRLGFLPCEALAETLTSLRARGYRIVASDLQGADFYARGELGERFVLVIGNEARGISPAVREAADCRVRLPMRGGAESLNAAVAAGIMMYEIMRLEDEGQ